MDDDGDDRWTCFQNHDKNSRLGIKVKDEEKPELADYLRIVLAQNSPRERQERKYKVALTLVKLVTRVAYNLSSEWKTYIEADSRTGVQTAPLRTLSEDVFDCMVPIKRPMRLDGLKSQIMDALGHSLNFRKGTSECFKLLFKKEEYEYEDRSLGGGKSNTGEQRPASEDQRKWNFLEDECDQLNSIAMRQTPHPDTIQQAKF